MNEISSRSTSAKQRRQTECVCINLRQMSRMVSQIYDDALAPAGLKITQFCLLRAIARLGPASVNALAADQELDRTTLTRNLALLEREGLIEQSPGADKRTSLAQLTRAGSAAVARALPHWQRVQEELRRSLGAQALTQLADIRERIGAACATASPGQ